MNYKNKERLFGYMENIHNKKIKIMHVAQAAGGVDRYLRSLLKYLDKDKFDNIVVFSQDFKKENYEGIASNYISINMERPIGKQDIKSVKEVRRLIKQYRPDIVYAHSSKAGAIVRIANIGMKNHCVYNPHGWAFNMKVSSKKQKLYALIEKLEAPFCDRIVCISNAEKKSALNKKICNENKMQVIFNGIDMEACKQSLSFNVWEKKINIPKDAFVIGMVGRISKQKAPDTFVEAAKMIKEKIANAYFIIVGSGDMEDEIIQYIHQNNMQKYFFITGWVENPMEYVEVFDVACLLSRWEGFGLVLPEYMLAGKPIVASKVDAIPDIIIDGENGILIPPDNSDAVKNAVLKLHEDKKFKNKLVMQGKKDVIKFDAKRMAGEHEKMFLNMLHSDC